MKNRKRLVWLVMGMAAIGLGAALASCAGSPPLQPAPTAATSSAPATPTAPAGSESAVVVVCTKTAKGALPCNYVADGKDDQREIQKAVDALPPAGGKVALSQGDFYLTGTVKVPSNVAIEGSGFETRLIAAKAPPYQLITNADWERGNSNIKISHLFLDGQRGANPPSGNKGGLVYFCNVRNGVIDGVWAQRSYKHGVELSHTLDSTVSNSSFYDNGDDGLSISDGWATPCGKAGDSVSRRIVVTNSEAWGNVQNTSSSGFEVDDGPSQIEFRGNTARGNTNGFEIHAHEKNAKTSNISYINNIAMENKQWGFGISDSDAFSLVGNQSLRNGGPGYVIRGDTKGGTMSNSVAEDNGTSNLLIEGTPGYAAFPENITVADTRLRRAATYNVKINFASDLEFTNVSAEGSASWSFYGIAFRGLTVTGGRISSGSSLQDGLAIGPDNERVKIIGVEITGNRQGIAIGRGVKDILVKDNHIHDNASRGVLLGADGAIIEGNTIEGQLAQGSIALRFVGSNTRVVNNIIRNNRVGANWEANTTGNVVADNNLSNSVNFSGPAAYRPLLERNIESPMAGPQ